MVFYYRNHHSEQEFNLGESFYNGVVMNNNEQAVENYVYSVLHIGRTDLFDTREFG